jgi:hypothetical protein
LFGNAVEDGVFAIVQLFVSGADVVRYPLAHDPVCPFNVASLLGISDGSCESCETHHDAPPGVIAKGYGEAKDFFRQKNGGGGRFEPRMNAYGRGETGELQYRIMNREMLNFEGGKRGVGESGSLNRK